MCQASRAISISMAILVIALPPIIWGQNAKWKQQNDRGNRYEGLIGIKTGSPGIEAISFTGFWEPFDKNIVLRIRFYLPTKATISITSQELEDLRQYWMEAKPISWRSAAW